jgi:hypothetical protein
MTEAAHSHFYCPECGYDLQGLDSDRCPECGHDIDRTTLGQSVLPWVQRKTLGTYRAFWKTVSMATFRPRFLAREMSSPARFDDALKFRRLVVLHALVPLGVLATVLYIILLHEVRLGQGVVRLWAPGDVSGSLLQVLSIPIWWICIGLTLYAMSGVGSFFFHPSSLPVVRQNRALALSYYTCGPMAYTLATLLLAVGGAFATGAAVRAKMPTLFVASILLVAYVPLVAQFLAVISSSVILLQTTTHTGPTRQIILAIFMPVAWAVLWFLLLVVVPVCWGALAITLLSFRR